MPVPLLVEYDAVNYPGIMIDSPIGASTFEATCRFALDKIISDRVGKRLLAEISARAPIFQPWNGKIKIPNANKPIEEGGSRAVAISEEKAANGTGSPSAVWWNSAVFEIPGQGKRPPFIGLAHELIHAWHNAHGIKKPTYDDEENFTVGLAAYMMPVAGAIPATITENMIRLEHGVPIRHRY